MGAAGNVDAAEAARRASREADIRSDRRAQVRPLLERAATREGVYRYVLGTIGLSDWNVDRLDELMDQLSRNTPLEHRHLYLGLDHDEFHASVEAYWNADLRASSELWRLWATAKYITPLMKTFDESAGQVETELAASKERYEAAFAEFHEAIVTLHKGAEAYIAGE